MLRHSPFREAPFREVQIVGGSSSSQVNSTEQVETGFQLQLDIRVILLSQGDFPNVHPVIRGTFSLKQIQKVPLARQWEYFLMNWQKIIAAPTILGYVEHFKILLHHL